MQRSSHLGTSSPLLGCFLRVIQKTGDVAVRANDALWLVVDFLHSPDVMNECTHKPKDVPDRV